MSAPKHHNSLAEDPQGPTARGDRFFRVLAGVVRPVYSMLISVSWTGEEHLPRDRGYIVVSNHVTEIDPITVAFPVYLNGTLPRFLAKESLFRVPVLGSLLRATSQIPVFRGSMDARKSLVAANKVVETGGAVMIYPEGTLTRDPDLWPMVGQSGAARLALATGAPVVPVAHWGDQELLEPKGTRLHPFPRKHAKVAIGRPLDFSDLDVGKETHYSREVLAEATGRMMDAVTDLLAGLRGQTAPEGRWDPRLGRRTGGAEEAQ